MEPRGCNRWQPAANRIGADAAKQAKTFALRWQGGGRRFESVRGLQLSPCLDVAFVFGAEAGLLVRCPRSVHQRPPCVESVEELDRVFASVAGEVAVVAVDHRQAGAHVTGEIEARDAGTLGAGREGV